MNRALDTIASSSLPLHESGHSRERHGATSSSCPAERTDAEKTARCEVLDHELLSIAREQAAIDVRAARCLRAIEHDATWRHFGFPTILAYLEDRLGVGPHTARDRLRVARELASLPLVEAALERGEISHSAVRELCRVADASTEAAWLERARGKNQRQIEDLVRGHRKGAHPDDDKRPDLEPRRVTLELSPATFALYRETISVLSDELGRHVDDNEAIATMCRRALEPTTEGPTRAPYQVAVTVCEGCRRGWRDGAGAVIEIEPADVEVALCDAEHIGSLDAEQPARAYQDVTPATRRLVWRRDHGKCRVEGCRSARNLDVHHVVHRADGGGHDAGNLVVMCSGCHAALHRGLIEVSGAAPSFVFRHRASRRPLLPDGASTAPKEASLRNDACECLKASGYSRSEAAAAVDKALSELGLNVSLEMLLKVALQRCRRG